MPHALANANCHGASLVSSPRVAMLSDNAATNTQRRNVSGKGSPAFHRRREKARLAVQALPARRAAMIAPGSANDAPRSRPSPAPMPHEMPALKNTRPKKTGQGYRPPSRRNAACDAGGAEEDPRLKNGSSNRTANEVGAAMNAAKMHPTDPEPVEGQRLLARESISEFSPVLVSGVGRMGGKTGFRTCRTPRIPRFGGALSSPDPRKDHKLLCYSPGVVLCVKPGPSAPGRRSSILGALSYPTAV